MRIITTYEREETNKKLHAEAERLRATMTPEELAKLHRLPHQGSRERARRLKRMQKSASFDAIALRPIEKGELVSEADIERKP